ncbi:hypothetical protein ACFRDV_18820 [Streptomyces fagopyri]|uniref:hypothetical protein n=1 Tax=Streptomyces fagopyri TaxID=2662397 RepID=UPI0036C61344
MFDRSASRRRLATAAVALSLLGTLSTSAWAGSHDTRPAAATAVRATPVPSTAGSTTALCGYAIQSTAKVTDSAADVSSPGCPAAGWYPAGSRSTVLAALLADGVYADPFHSTAHQRIPEADFTDSRGRTVSRNVYWLSTRADTLDRARTDWYHTPTTAYADLTGLGGTARVPVTATASTTAGARGTSTTTVTVRGPRTGKAPSLLTDVHLVDSKGRPVLPVRWSDHQVGLWPGESATSTATYRTADLHGAVPRVRISGWNTPERTVPAA